jgi:hypothetical protein
MYRKPYFNDVREVFSAVPIRLIDILQRLGETFR